MLSMIFSSGSVERAHDDAARPAARRDGAKSAIATRTSSYVGTCGAGIGHSGRVHAHERVRQAGFLESLSPQDAGVARSARGAVGARIVAAAGERVVDPEGETGAHDVALG